MTGKTSMAALLTQQLTSIANDANKKTLVINISVVQLSSKSESWNFENAFKNLLDIEFGELDTIAKIRDVYLILDEAQLLYTQRNSPSNKSTILWQKVKALFSMNKSPLKIVLFAGYGSSTQNAGLSTPVTFDPDAMFGVELMKFTDAEMSEYVKKNLEVVSFLDVSVSTPNGETLCAIEFFCRNLKYLTGSHVGLCCASIKAINNAFHSDMKHGLPLSPQVVIAKLWSKSVMNALMLTRAVSVLNFATPDEMGMLKELASGNEHLDKRIGSACVSKGILIEQNDGFAFASTVMSRYFLLQLNGDPPQRAQFNPLNLKELLVRVFASFDYGHLQLSLGKTKSSGILLERAWQMEFYRKAIQCTADMVTSADVGALFNSRGSIDFTIHSEDITGEKKVIGKGTQVHGLKRDGTEFPLQISISEVVEDGFHLFTAIVRDMTELVEEENYKQSTETQMMWRIDNTGKVLSLNLKFKKYAGITKPEEEATADVCSPAMVHPQDLQASLDKFAEGRRTKKPFDIKRRLKGVDGHYRWFLTSALPVFSTHGEFKFWVGGCTDIDDAEVLNAELTTMQEDLPVFLWKCKPNGSIYYGNLERMFLFNRKGNGYKILKLLTNRFSLAVMNPPEDTKLFINPLRFEQ
ncbi:hypothetical protein HDV02_001676 [Globomyces sp. JEL0801]|nr:hypothetical protein HDV02_001676 [Globomyces sp. JEL0801]